MLKNITNLYDRIEINVRKTLPTEKFKLPFISFHSIFNRKQKELNIYRKIGFLVNYLKQLWILMIVKTNVQYYFQKFDQDFAIILAPEFCSQQDSLPRSFFMSYISCLFGLIK